MHVTVGTPGRPIALVMPGAASTADFVTRAFGPALSRAGYALVTADPPTRDPSDATRLAQLRASVRQWRPSLVCGISLGSHLALRWAAEDPAEMRAAGVTGLIAALPAWTGAPDGVARLSARAARDVKRHGVDSACAHMAGRAPDWIVEETTRAWSRYDSESLAAALWATAASAAPTLGELARVRLPVGLVAVSDDPGHPLATALRWHGSLRRSGLRTTTLDDIGVDRSRLGALGLAALRTARASSERPA